MYQGQRSRTGNGGCAGMTAKTWAALIEGMIPISLGIYVLLLAQHKLGKKPSASPHWADWHRKWDKTLKITGPLLVITGLFSTWPFFDAVTSSAYWSVENSPFAPLAVGSEWAYKAGNLEITTRVASHERMGNVK